MKLLSHKLALLSLPLALCGSLFGQAYTTPVGAVSVTVPSGTSILTIPFQHPKVFQGAVVGLSGSSVELSAAVDIPDNLYYLQVISGDAIGVFLTVSSVSGATLTLEASIPQLQVGDIVAVRKHFVISDLQGIPDFTSITLLNGNGPVDIAQNIFGWDNPNLPIFPGEGILINSGTSFDLTLLGSVSVDDILVTLPSGTSIIGTLDPVGGAQTVVEGLSNAFPDFTSLTEIVAGSVKSYDYFFGTWSADLNNIDFSNGKSVLVNSGFDLQYVLAGFEF